MSTTLPAQSSSSAGEMEASVADLVEPPSPCPSLDSLLSMVSEDFGTKSWVELIEEEERRLSSYEASETSDQEEVPEQNEPLNVSLSISSAGIICQPLAPVKEEPEAEAANENMEISPMKGIKFEEGYGTVCASQESSLPPETAGSSSKRKTLVPKKQSETQPKFARRSVAMAEALQNVSRGRENRSTNKSQTTPNRSQERVNRKRVIEKTPTTQNNEQSESIQEKRGSCSSPPKRYRDGNGDPKASSFQRSSVLQRPTTPVQVGFILRPDSRGQQSLLESPHWSANSMFYENVPKNGWCYDEATLARRTKEINRMKELPVYARYVTEVPKETRDKNTHPRTPNKFLNHTRRSWDKQIKLWKRSIYKWAGMSPTSSVASSNCPSECSSDNEQEDQEIDSTKSSPTKVKEEKRDQPMFQDVTISLHNTDTQIASLFGHFDMNTRMSYAAAASGTASAAVVGDDGGNTLQGGENTLTFGGGGESTLKAAPINLMTQSSSSSENKKTNEAVGAPIPTDFSQLSYAAAAKKMANMK